MPDSKMFQSLTPEQQELVRTAFGSSKYECSGCARYLGATSLGDHTTFWHYGASSGYVALPLGGSPHFSYDTGHLYIHDPATGVQREFDLDGREHTPPFKILLHFDIRKWEEYLATDEGKSELLAGENYSDSYLPEHAAKRIGVEPKVPLDWVGHFWLKPWELTQGIVGAALALTVVFRGHNERRIVIL